MINTFQICLPVLFYVLGATALRAEQPDVTVMGGTPGGIAAALSAARGGRTVTLVEYHHHIGGMMASGLGKSDIENRAMVGGVFKEFVENVRTHYVTTYGEDHENVKLSRDGYYFEPSVAESVFEKMLREQPRITVMKGWRLNAARVTNQRLTAIEVVNRRTGKTRTLGGQVFIDATYEGDLYAAAGAEYRLGRESRDQYGEPHAGVVYFDYQAKQFLPRTTGAADDRLPAYTYRLCLTTDPANAHRLTAPPPDYDRTRYLGYFDDLAAGRLAGPKIFKPGRGYNPAHFDTLVRALSVTEIPNRKTDVNINPRPLGFPFAEENRGYVEGDDATRQRIRERHRNLTIGLLWFLQNDPEVPEPHRRLANELHLPGDEFTDNGHFPFQLYVREARRLVGEYTLTEHDVTDQGKGNAPRHHQDSIAIGEFPIDSFPCRKRQPGDTIVLEGYLGMLDHITRPYEIPYRIMIPRQIDGLIVPVAASTTHVAFSSIRMEPTWMALGQAAGVAAHLAIEQDLPPREVAVKKIQRLLIQQGQVLRHAKEWAGTETSSPDAVSNPQSPLMLAGEWVPADPRRIDFDHLPRVPSEHAVVSDVRDRGGTRVNQHNYLVHHEGRFWVMWSDGPGLPRAEARDHRNVVPGHDRAGQRVSFATSNDGLSWSETKDLTGAPEEGFGWIARGFWVREGRLLALSSRYKAPGYAGEGLQLHAFELQSGESPLWRHLGVACDDTLNNFPPKKLPTGEWMMSRRDHRRNVHFLLGGTRSFDEWKSFHMVGYEDATLAAEEPYWWLLPDANLVALFRDNRRSGFLYRAFSTDGGKSWSKPTRTNFPDAASKFSGLRLSDGRYVLVSNSNPRRRDPLTIAISDDGLVFDKLGYLVGGRHVDYPHVIEHEGYLFIAFAGAKQTVEVLKIRIADLDVLSNSRGG